MFVFFSVRTLIGVAYPQIWQDIDILGELPQVQHYNYSFHSLGQVHQIQPMNICCHPQDKKPECCGADQREKKTQKIPILVTCRIILRNWCSSNDDIVVKGTFGILIYLYFFHMLEVVDPSLLKSDMCLMLILVKHIYFCNWSLPQYQKHIDLAHHYHTISLCCGLPYHSLSLVLPNNYLQKKVSALSFKLITFLILILLLIV